MITIVGSTAAAEAYLRSVQQRLSHTIDTSVEDTLDEVIQMLQPVTPVVTGAMQADYTIAGGGGGVWELLDTATSPGGYDYPERVFSDPNWSRQYSALNRTLEAGERLLATKLDAAITNMIQAP